MSAEAVSRVAPVEANTHPAPRPRPARREELLRGPAASLHVKATPLALSAATYLAGMLAMGLSMWLALPRPWWVLMAVYVTTQPLAGSLRPKMVYRLTGVVVGATFAVLAVGQLIDSPFLMSGVLALWVGGCIFLAVRDRTPRTFGFMLAGYTAAIVAFPYIDQPADIFLIALARVEEMFIAIICAGVVHMVLLPWDPVSVLRGRLPVFLTDARAWFRDALEGLHGFKAEKERQRFAADLAELSILSVHLPPETFVDGVSRRHVSAFQGSMSALLSLASGVEDRLRALREREALPEPIADLVRDVNGWLASGAASSRAEARRLQARCRALMPDLNGDSTWEALLIGSLCQRLSEFVEAYADSHELMDHLRGESQIDPQRFEKLARRQDPVRLRTYRGLALLSGAGAAVAVFLYCSTWIMLSWPEGLATAAFAAIVSCSFASQDDPAPGILKYLLFTISALPISAFYLFVILPRVDGLLWLAVMLAPVLLFMGWIQATPSRAPYALPMLACFIVAMGFLERYTADFARFINVATAQMGGVIVTIGSARLFRSVGADWTARRLLRRGWRELAALASRDGEEDELAWSRHMVDRLGLVAARMAYVGPGEPMRDADALADLRLGRNIIQLHRARAGLNVPELDQVLTEFSAFCGERAKHSAPVPPPPTLLQAIDKALVHLGQAAPVEARQHGYLALAGMRRNLFPQASAWLKAAAV